MTGGWHFGAGASAFGAAEGIWALGHHLWEFPSAWVLKPTSGIVFCAFVLVLSGAAMAAIRKSDMSWLQSFALTATGAYAALILILFFVLGPGNLWPLVLLLDAVIVFPSLFVGALLGDIVRDVRRRAA